MTSLISHRRKGVDVDVVLRSCGTALAAKLGVAAKLDEVSK
jgi:hypothetical protein